MADAFREMIDRVKNRAGIAEDKAKNAVDAVVGYIKDKSPSIGSQVEGFVHGGGSEGTTGKAKDHLGL